MKIKIILFLLGLFSGISLWIFIPQFFDGNEPWDGGQLVYIVSLAAIGVCIGFVRGRIYLFGILGLYVGQWLACFPPRLIGKTGDLPFSLPVAIFRGSLLLLLFTLVSFVAALISNKINKIQDARSKIFWAVIVGLLISVVAGLLVWFTTGA